MFFKNFFKFLPFSSDAVDLRPSSSRQGLPQPFQSQPMEFVFELSEFAVQ